MNDLENGVAETNKPYFFNEIKKRANSEILAMITYWFYKEGKAAHIKNTAKNKGRKPTDDELSDWQSGQCSDEMIDLYATKAEQFLNWFIGNLITTGHVALDEKRKEVDVIASNNEKMRVENEKTKKELQSKENELTAREKKCLGKEKTIERREKSCHVKPRYNFWASVLCGFLGSLAFALFIAALYFIFKAKDATVAETVTSILEKIK